MGLDEIRQRKTIDLAERIEQLREDLIPRLDERIERAREYERLRRHPEETVQDHDAYPDEGSDELEQLRDNRKGEADAHERTMQGLCPEHSFDPQRHDEHPCPGVDCDHADGEFVIQELLTAETSQLTDDMQKRSFDVDLQRQDATAAPQGGFHRTRLLELAVIDAPAEMETSHDRDLGRETYAVGDLPDHTSDYLYQCAIKLNDVGPEAVSEVGNLASYGVVVEGETSSAPADNSDEASTSAQ